MPRPTVSLEDKYALDTTSAYISGIEALARLPMLQHQRDLARGFNTAGFIAGYRGSPLGGLDQALWKAKPYLDRHHIHFLAAVNEDLAATAVWGSQQVNLFPGGKYDGVFALWYGKGPGVDRSMDVIKHANAFGSAPLGGVLAVVGDDHGAKSSTLAHQSEHMFIGASVPVLNPANVQEVLDFGILGWELSRYCGCWVALKAITDNMDAAISAQIDPCRVQISLPVDFVLPSDGVHGRWPDSALAQELRLNKYKIYAALAFARANKLNSTVMDSEQPRLGIMTTGKAHLDVMQALEDLGIDSAKAAALGLRVFKVGMSWPLEPVATHDFARGLEEILVVEEKRSVMEDQLTGQLYNWPVGERPIVVGEYDEHGVDLLPNVGELTPALVARAIASRIRRYHTDPVIEQRLHFYQQKEQSLAMPRRHLQRKPHYCSGCPHSRSTRIPSGSIALGGIGCHYMGIWETGDREVKTFTQMGGEGVTWVGQAPFTERAHVFQNLGDGTYFHSGLLAIRQTIASGVNITYKILYNDAVAMTGGQPVDGPFSVEQLILQLRAEGVARIALVSENAASQRKSLQLFEGLTIDPRDRLLAIETELREITGTSVLIYQQGCAAQKRRSRNRGQLPAPQQRVVINPELCEGCGDCSRQSNCLSVQPLATELGRKRQIDQRSCNQDFSCLDGFCPSLVTVVGAELRKPILAKTAADSDDFPPLLDPPPASIEQRPWNIVVAGIGGTGVLTVAALVAMAAHIEGLGCATMNQTGLAQKFGAVLSHVRVALSQSAIHTMRIPAGDADLLLGCDLVVAADDEALAKVNIDRSYALINSAETVTGDFVNDPDLDFPSAAMQQSIVEEVGQGAHFISSGAIAEALFGDTSANNVFLLGYACQQSLLPVSVRALEQAIKLNDVAVALNLNAFLWGRRAAQDLARVLAVAQLAPTFEALSGLNEIVEDRCRRLVDYHSAAYADRYRALVAKVYAYEQLLWADSDAVLSKAVAVNYYKLLAYKDEYEVARLYSNGAFKRHLATLFEGQVGVDYHLEYHLAPPLLAGRDPDTGATLKRRFPHCAGVLFKVLASLKFLRGTVFDVFSYSGDRKLERRMVTDYEQTIDSILACADPNMLNVAVELASAAQHIRGFGSVKERSYAEFTALTKPLLQQLRGEVVQLFSAVEGRR